MGLRFSHIAVAAIKAAEAVFSAEVPLAAPLVAVADVEVTQAIKKKKAKKKAAARAAKKAAASGT